MCSQGASTGYNLAPLKVTDCLDYTLADETGGILCAETEF